MVRIHKLEIVIVDDTDKTYFECTTQFEGYAQVIAEHIIEQAYKEDAFAELLYEIQKQLTKEMLSKPTNVKAQA
jgi:hypothetical protein